MARKTAKKQAEAPKVDIGAEIFASLRELEKLKGIPVDYMVERLKQALTNAYRKDREDRRDVPADNVVVDLSEHGLSMHIVKTAVEVYGLTPARCWKVKRKWRIPRWRSPSTPPGTITPTFRWATR